MKKSITVFGFIGISAAIIALICLEYALFTINFFNINPVAGRIISGALLGSIFGMILLSADGILLSNTVKLKRGLIFGFSGGFIGGAVGFAITEFILIEKAAGDAFNWRQFFALSQRWLILGALIGAASAIRDGKKSRLIKMITIGLLGGLAGGIAQQITFTVLAPGVVARAVGLLAFGIVISLSLHLSGFIGRKVWLKVLNGQQKNIEFELSEPLHFMGDYYADDIFLNSYHGINQTHAKLEKINGFYSLLDNDHFGRTYVNFRPVQEQPLKKGDVIKVGTALLQYCTKGA